MTAKRREYERPRIDVSAQSMLIIEDIMERGYYESIRDLIADALPLLQIKLVNDAHMQESSEERENMREMTELQLKEIDE